MTVRCPAKLNLYLAVTGRRPDGFHDLVSLVVPVAWGDDLTFSPQSDAADFTLTCDDPALDCGPSNLVLRAAVAFARAVPTVPRGHFHLTKRIPTGAGLGGGSSDAIGAWRLLAAASGRPPPDPSWTEVAAGLGSDCPLFLHSGPVVLRGRGERIEPLAPALASRWVGRRVWILRPPFAVATPWAYGQLIAGAPDSYTGPADAERALAALLAGQADSDPLASNSFARPVFRKFVALDVLAARLRADWDLSLRLSGSGSACFVWPEPGQEAAAFSAWCEARLGREARLFETTVTG